MNKKLYKNYHKHYHQGGEKDFKRYQNYFRKNYFKHLPKNKQIKILDIGCGSGFFLIFLKNEGYQNIKGIDLSPANVKQCQNSGLNVNKKNAFKYLKENQQKYDLIVINDVIEHIKKERVIDFLKLINKRLAKQGKLIVKTPNMSNSLAANSLYCDFTHEYGYTEKNLSQISQITGFSKIKFYNLIVYPNIIFLDQIFWLINKIIFLNQKIRYTFYGKTGYRVFSKNILAILKK